MKHLRLNAKEDRRLLRGHLWAYRNEFAALPELDDAQLVDLYSDQGRFVGRGFYQAQGGIAVRILSRHQVEIDGAFFLGRVQQAREFRERLFPQQNVYRWVFGESDGLPGFVADRYGSVVACETAAPFYRAHANHLAHAFMSTEGVCGVRMDIAGETLSFGDLAPEVQFDVEGVRMAINMQGGQKTGFFLDQRLNSAGIRRFSKGARILDGHCYVGIWSCHAGLAGAASVLGVDTSQPAIERARENARLNGVETTCAFERADVMAVLQRGDQYDVVVLDPPAFAKSRVQENKALGLYQNLNRTALDALAPGGILITSTCSHFVGRETFLEILKRAVTSAQRQAWILNISGAAPDHPVMMAMPETEYLTCVTMRVF